MKKPDSITNTAETMATPEGALNLLVGLTDAKSIGGSIEAMEAKGQKELVASSQLPMECSPGGREALIKAGVIFGEVSQGDKLFCNVTLPQGWRKVGTDHSMWSDLRDEKDRVRARIFYKAAFYDRRAHMSVITRFTLESDYKDKVCFYRVKDGNTLLFETPCNEESRTSHEQAEAWISEKYPEWKDHSAYWDLP